MKQEG